jgi:hypothetical protein
MITPLSHESVLFLREQTYDKVDKEFFCQYSMNLLIKRKCYTYCKLEFLARPILIVSTRKIIHHELIHNIVNNNNNKIARYKL